ncbi:MAG: TIGR00730 family Rossman fold protein [Bacteroidaceae bacterium]|nr:TIGR00730 family Rossman fold protein [Bacteroidaceae bacterium]
MKIGVFCSANNNIADLYFEKTAELGKWIGDGGHSLVFGGCNIGLMDCVAQAARKAGATIIGVVPSKVEQGGKMSDILDVTIHTDNLSDRKDMLLLHSDVLVALPGGIGTLDEIFMVAASHTIGYHQKKVILYNINGFWDSMIALLDDLASKNMIRGKVADCIMVANTLEEMEALIQN